MLRFFKIILLIIRSITFLLLFQYTHFQEPWKIKAFEHFVRTKCLFEFDSSRWFAGQIIKYSVDSANLVDDSAHDALQYCKWNFCRFGGHKVDGINCTKCNCIVIRSFVTHYTNGTHVSQGCEILVRHPGWCCSMLCFVSCNCFVHFVTVNVIGILDDADFFCIYLTDDTDSKTRTREWLTEYQFFRNAEFQSGFADFIFEEVTQ